MAFFIACSPHDKAADESATATTSDTTAAATTAAYEIGNTANVDAVKKHLQSLAAKDIPAFVSVLADNAVYNWNNGDSIAGKPAITEYWTKRMSETVDSLWFADEIFIPVKINTPQATEDPGQYVLAWYSVKAKYKTGKTMQQWMHAVNHFNDAGQIDQIILFRDNKSIAEAMSK